MMSCSPGARTYELSQLAGIRTQGTPEIEPRDQLSIQEMVAHNLSINELECRSVLIDRAIRQLEVRSVTPHRCVCLGWFTLSWVHTNFGPVLTIGENDRRPRKMNLSHSGNRLVTFV